MLIKYKSQEPKLSKTSFVASTATLIGNCEIGNNASVWYGAVLRGDIAPIIVGEGSNIQDNSVCHVDFDKPVIIGKNVTIGHNVTLHGCTIKDGALIGMGAIILDGAVIEEGALIGAGAIVTPNTIVQSNSLYLGNPAREKRPLTQEEIAEILENSRIYVKLLKEHKKAIKVLV